MDIILAFEASVGGSNPSESVSGSKGFEPLERSQCAPVAQLAEQRTLNPKVAGSNPAGRKIKQLIFIKEWLYNIF